MAIGNNTETKQLTVNKFGEQTDIDTADVVAGLASTNFGQIAWTKKATVQLYEFIDGFDDPRTVEVVSSSVEDAAGLTGAYTIGVEYLDVSGFKQTKNITMTGTTAVPFGAAINGTFRSKVLTSGATKKAVGNIIIRDTTTAKIYLEIKAGKGQTLIAVDKVPSNKKGVIRSHYMKYAKQANNQGANAVLYVRNQDGTTQEKYPATLTTVSTKDEKDYLIGGIFLDPGDHYFWSVINVTQDNTPIQAGFDVELETIV